MTITQENKIQVVWLSQRYDGHSFFTSSSNILAKLNSQNFSITCVYLEKCSEEPNLLEALGCRVVYLGRAGATSKFNPFILRKLIHFLRDNAIDILHCHRHKATLYGSFAACIATIPVVFSHVHGLKRTRSIPRRLANRVLYKMVSKVIAVSDAVRKDVIASNPGLPSEKVIAIRNSIDFKKFSNINITRQKAREILGLPQEAFVFGTVARLVPTKGQSYLIDAFAKVHGSELNSHLVFVGNGRLESALKHQAANLGCLDAITFAGQRNDIPQVLRALDSFLLPSIAEGFPLSLLEAMAASLPCIASAVGGIPEVIMDERVGYLVPSKDSDALAKSMLACRFSSDAERHEMGMAACDLVRTCFSNDIYTLELKKIYEDELLKK